MQHDDAERKDLFQVMEAFSKVKDADGKMVGMICMMKSSMTNPKEPSHSEI